MLNIALTGNIASGKSAVAELFQRWGATVIDADRLVRESQAPGQPVLRAIANALGEEFIGPGGELRRDALRRRIMVDPAARATLERLVHPEVLRRRAALESAARARGDPIVVSDIPLLFESADPSLFDAVILVDAAPALRRRRLIAERGLSEEEATSMIASQMPSELKRARSTWVIDNDGSREELERAAAAVWRALLARA
ncbi:MAG: dephospho-CoA kinase [Gemmatimonadales bacterium]